MTPSKPRSRRAVVASFAAGAATGIATHAGAALGVLASSCAAQGTVPLRVDFDKRTAPRDASVFIDEEYVGPLYLVSSLRGLTLKVGTHRVTVEKEGYFPWDKLVTADREPITLDVVLTPIPD